MTQLSIKTNLPIVRQGLEDFAAEVPKVGRKRIYDQMVILRRRMRTPGKAIRYPVKWDSEKQRRAFFATDGFGRGIPSVRTGQYARAWDIVKLDNGYQMVNNTSYAQYVGGNAYGQAQSNIHQRRWNVLRDEAEAVIQNLPDEIENDIKMVARRKGLD